MTSNGLMLSAANVIKSVKEIAQPGTAKLLIDKDGTVRLEANSNFPTPGTNDKQTLFAACTDDGQTNVYYSPSGNPSEVYLLKPTAKSAGKQLRLTTREPTNIEASTVEDHPNQSDQNQNNPSVMSMIEQDTVVQKPSSLPSSVSQGVQTTEILSPPSVCSIATSTSTSSSPVDSPVDDSDFPIDLPVSFEADIKDSGVNSDMDELDSLLPDIGSTIAAHLQNKDSQQNPVAQKENLVKCLLTQKSPVIIPHTTMANNASVKIPMSYKNVATKPVPNSHGQLLLFTTSTGQNQCIYLSENEKIPPGVQDFTKSIPTMVTNSSVQPPGNAFSLLQSSFKLTGATTQYKPLNTVSLLKGPVSPKTAPRILTVNNHPQTKPVPSSQQTSVPVIVIPKSIPTTKSYQPTKNIQTLVPIQVMPYTIPALPNTNVTKISSGNTSGLKFVSSNTSSTIKTSSTQNTNPESTITKIGNSTASQYLQKIVVKASGSREKETVVVYPKVSSDESTVCDNTVEVYPKLSSDESTVCENTVEVYPKVSSDESTVCENINNSNNKDDDIVKESEDTSCNIRIDSVFSLSEPSQTTEQSEEKTKKDGKRKRKNANKDKKFKWVTEVKEYKCKPMYVVLERLNMSKGTVNIHDDALSKTKCTDYCRKRTLNCLCGIDLLDCKNPALSSKAKYLQRRRIEITPSSPNKVARYSTDTDVKSRCVDDWTLVEEVSKEITTTANPVPKPIVLRDHSSYTTSSQSSYIKYGNHPKVPRTTVTMLPTNVTVADSKVHSTQQAFYGALKKAVASKVVPSSTTETKSLLQNTSTLIKIPLTVSSTKPSNPPIVAGTVSSSTTTITIPSTTSSLSKVTSPIAPAKAPQNVLNGKFYLVTIDGKNVLIPTDKSANSKAFILQQAADGTTGLIPACLSYNKVTPTAPINTIASKRVTSVSTSQSVLNIRSIAPRTNSSVASFNSLITPNTNSVVSNTNILVASNTKTSMTCIPTGPTLTKTIQLPRQSITAASVSKPQTVSMVPNTRLATPDTKTMPPIIQATIARPSNTDTPSPTIDSTKKRKKTLAERYPLPPGVIIKQEPRTTGYGDEPKKEEVPVIKSVHPSPLPVASNRSRLVQSVLTPFVIPRPATTSTSTILTLTNTTVNSRSLLRNTAPIQSTGSINRSITVPSTNLRTVNVSQPIAQSRNPQPVKPPINFVKHFPTVTYRAPQPAQGPPISVPIMKNNIITFTKLPNNNAFQEIPTKHHNSSMPLKTQVNATERPIPVLISREQSVNSKIVENNSRSGSPGPPDLGEPQIILPSKVAKQASNESDTDSDTECALYPFPLFNSPVLEKRLEEPKAKTPQELRIEKLKKQLREQERALEEMRKKKAFECPIDVDDV